MRSLILAPTAGLADLRSAAASGANGVILALAPPFHAQPSIREAREWPASVQLIIDATARDGPDLETGLAAAMAWAPDAILLRGAAGRRDLQRMGAMLAVAEAEHDRPDGATRIILAVDSAVGALALPTLAAASPRLAALAFDGACLAKALGCDPEAGPVAQSRHATVLAAAAAGVPAYVALDRGDAAGSALAARRDGFAGIWAACADDMAAAQQALRT